MAVYDRTSILKGQSIALRAIYRDDANCLVSTDAAPEVYIYDDASLRDSDIKAGTYTNAIAGPFTSTELSTGYYEYEFAVPTSYDEQLYFDVWVAALDGGNVTSWLSFTVIEGLVVTSQDVGDNTMLVIQLDSSIGNLAGDDTLGADTQIYFNTKYNPYYASVDLVRLEVGNWISYIPDDTLALLIHWSSKEADFIGSCPVKNANDFALARTKYVVYDVAMRVLNMAGHGTSPGSQSTGARKQLGDLTIQNGSDGSIDLDADVVNWIRTQREDWMKVLNSGGSLMLGQSFDPTFAVKGTYDPDRRNVGRLWEGQSDNYYHVPTINTKERRPGRRRGRFTHRQRQQKTGRYGKA